MLKLKTHSGFHDLFLKQSIPMPHISSNHDEFLCYVDEKQTEEVKNVEITFDLILKVFVLTPHFDSSIR